ncbi:zinc finger protein Eos [Syngnathus acus]|uniref:zinc finger protein Eos n=1 Tax=Syngnathus acus TaxID=161584 RepID=UPI001886306A|nr:zinc finger protein Eos [Syngnathus acus]XP_037134449.1 zinc finger protein Eos [Syngnathus acus]XP_037134451.1 zinc finger protein Eos [Syngnathus acus]
MMQASGESMNADDCNGCAHSSGNEPEPSTDSTNGQRTLTRRSHAEKPVEVEPRAEEKSPPSPNRAEPTEDGGARHTGLGAGNLYGESAASKSASPGPVRLPNGKFQCDVCGIICIGPNVLMVHKRSHTGERPFQCNQCGASFTQKGNLLRHIKLHSGEKPFKCPICNYACRRRDALAGHLRTHAVSSPLGGKPFKCIYCSRSYKQQSTLEDHFDRCHTFLKNQDHKAAVNSKRLQQDDQSLNLETMAERTLDTSSGKAQFADRLAVSITKRKRSTPQKFLADKRIHLEVPCDLSSGSEREGEQPKPQDVAFDPAFSCELRAILGSANRKVPPQGAPGGLSLPPLGPPSQEAGEGCDGLPSLHSHATSPDGCPDSTDTESTAEDLSARAAVQTRTSNNNQHLHYQSLALPYGLSGLGPEWERVCPSPPASAKRGVGAPLPSGEKLRVLDRDGRPVRCFHCRHCRILFLDHVMFTIHMGCHGFRRPFECNICGHCSRDRYEFSSHMSRGEHRLA